MAPGPALFARSPLLAAALPPPLAATAFVDAVLLHAAVDAPFGQTLILHTGTRLAVATRSAMLDDFRAVALADGAPLTFAEGTLQLTAADGTVHGLTVSPFEARELGPLLARPLEAEPLSASAEPATQPGPGPGPSTPAPSEGIAQHLAALRADLDDWPRYHALFDLYREVGRGARARDMAGLLVLHDKATKEERHHYERRAPSGLPVITGEMEDRDWAALTIGPRRNRWFDEHFSLVYQMLGPAVGRTTLRRLGLKRRRDGVDPETHSGIVAVVDHVSRALNIQPPELFLKRYGGETSILPTYPVIIALDPDRLARLSEPEFAFDLARTQGCFHRWHLLAALFAKAELDLFAAASKSLVDVEWSLPLSPSMPVEQQIAIANQVAAVREQLARHSTAGQRTALQRQWAGSTGWDGSLLGFCEGWHHSVHAACLFAALLAVDDVVVAGRMIRTHHREADPFDRGEAMRLLHRFVLSERWPALRERVGLRE